MSNAFNLVPPPTSHSSFLRPSSAISTSTTIIDHEINPSFGFQLYNPASVPSSTHPPSGLTPQRISINVDDYEHRLKLVNDNRAKLTDQFSSSLHPVIESHLTPQSSPSLPLSFDSVLHPSSISNSDLLDLIQLEFLLASSSNPNPLRLTLDFKPSSKVSEVKDSIRSHWPNSLSPSLIILISSHLISLSFFFLSFFFFWKLYILLLILIPLWCHTPLPLLQSKRVKRDEIRAILVAHLVLIILL